MSSAPFFSSKKQKILVVAFFVVGTIIALVLAIIIILQHTVWKPAARNTMLSNASSANNVSVASLEEAYSSLYENGVKDFEPGKKQQTITAFKDLAGGFTIDETFYQDKANVLIGLGIAYLYASDTANKDAYRNELYLLTAPYLSSLPSGISDQYFQTDQTSDEAILKIFDKYTDKVLTKQLSDTITTSGVTQEAAANLKLGDASKLASYHIVALDFDNASDRQKEFAKEHYMFGAQPKMWVESVGSDVYIFFAKNYAQEFIKDPNGSQRSSVIHEFIHAQHPFNRGDLGRTIEERRAENFSGDKSSYYDAKQLFIYSDVFSGISMLGMLNQTPTDPASFYLNLYSKYGVSGANHIVASWPNVYLGDPSEAVKKVNALSGGLNGAIEASIAVGQKNQTAMNQRMKTRVDKLMEVFKAKEKVLQDLENNLGENYRMPAAAAKMKDYINQNF